jgi:3-methyladenine DNA glycosylase AlkD
LNIEDLYTAIKDDLENKAAKNFDSKQTYLNWQQDYYQKHGDKAFGLRVPEIELIGKKYHNEFKNLTLEDRLTLTRKFYQSDYITLTNFGLKLLQISIAELNPQNFAFLDEMLGYITDWGPTDAFSLYIMQPLLRTYPNETKQLLKQWNASDHLWKKRASVVTFTRKIGKEGKFVDFLLELCNNLIWDNEDLVRKGIGWALKDNMIGENKEKVLNYVKVLRKKGVSSTITLYAIRRLKGKERADVLMIKPH